MATMHPDERAAGVISGSDPYRELELYLEKVNEEIGEVFDRWKSSETKYKHPVTATVPIPPARRRDNHQFDPKILKGTEGPIAPPRRSPRRNSEDASVNRTTDTKNISEARTHNFETCEEKNKNFKIRRNGSFRNESASKKKQRNIERELSLNSWSDGILAEFNSIITDELIKLQCQEVKQISVQNENKFENNFNFITKDNNSQNNNMKLRISRSQSWDEHQSNCSDLCCTAPASPDSRSGSQRTPSLSKIVKKQLSAGVVTDITEPGNAVLVRVASLPEDDVIHKTLSDSDIAKRTKVYSRGTMTIGRRISVKSASIDLPVSTVKPNRPTAKNVLESNIYKDVLKRCVNSNSVTSYNENCVDSHVRYPEPVNHSLGLRNQHLNNYDFDFIRNCKRKENPNSPSNENCKDSSRANVLFASMEDMEDRSYGSFRRSGSGKFPVALQSLLTKIRPRKMQTRSPTLSPERHSKGRMSVDMATQTSPPLSRSSSFTWVSDCSSSFLLNINDSLDDDNRSTSSSADSRRHINGVCGCDYDCTSSRDSLSDSHSGSADSPDREEEPESGIGTASPPRSKDHKIVLVSENNFNKPKRKETWERLRRRSSSARPYVSVCSNTCQDIWIRRESVETQTYKTGDENREINVKHLSLEDSNNNLDSSSGQDDSSTATECNEQSQEPISRSRPRAVRPHCLPIKPQRLRCTPSPIASPEQFDRKFSIGDLRQQQKLPSPTATSLRIASAPRPIDFGNKSSSAPLLVKKTASPGRGGRKVEDNAKNRVLKQPRSHSERHLAEIEAAEACKWLRAAGFPQYAQMYEDLQFPIDVTGVQKDHPFLDPDSLQSLFRRLHALNRCAKMKVDNLPKKNKGEDSDEEDHCALSENWTFQPEIRRWSRVCEITADHMERLQTLSAARQGQEKEDQEDDNHLADLRDYEDEEEDFDPNEIPIISPLRYGSLPPGSGDTELLASKFRRTGSERLRDGAKALLRRMESLKSRRRKRQNREGVVIGSPQVLDVFTMQQRMKDMNCVDVSPTSPHPPSANLPPTGLTVPSPSANVTSAFGDDSSSYCSDGSSTTPPNNRGRSKPGRIRKFGQGRGRLEEGGTLSDSECHPSSWRQQYLKDANSNHTKVLEYVDDSTRGAHDQDPAQRSPGSGKQQTRGGSLNLGKDSQRYRDKLEHKLRKDSSVSDKSVSLEIPASQESSSTLASQGDSDRDEPDAVPRQKSGVVRWHSFQRGSSRPDSLLLRQESIQQGAVSMGALSCGQLLVLRKLALLRLTGYMEKYCPTHRTGWNWELPKFIRKIKAPDYKDKTVFGVPLLISLQRNGQALPKSIQQALRWMRVNCLDQIGIFRKSGVRSRIQKLKQMTETQGDAITFDGQQAYDVADMVKQYFRELPEALLTNKLSETFIAIFQYVPPNLRPEAVQWVLLMLPDEHREALQTLLEFMNQVSSRAAWNQMNASNLAVCLAPSLFHLHQSNSSSNGGRSASASPRRRKTVGIPDPRELNENKAAHDCLLYLIKEQKNLFVVSEDMISQCHFNYMEESIPVALEELGAEFNQDWRGYLSTCTTALLKEAREKSRGWVSVPCSTDHLVDMAYKKVGDGHPLRLWRLSTDVEAPPQEVLHQLLRERHVWDHNLLKWRVVARLDTQVEVFQYVCANMSPLTAKDYCVLRSWRTDLAKGACVIVETSVEHPDAPVMLGGVRGIVLASRYLIEPCGSGRSRIMHLSRVDTKGRTPEWYNKSYGHLCSLHLTRIRTSFKHNTEGPESKV